MPIARFQMPDGRVARFEVPDGTTPEQAQAIGEQFASQQAPQGSPMVSPQASAMAAEGMGSLDSLAVAAGQGFDKTAMGLKELALKGVQRFAPQSFAAAAGQELQSLQADESVKDSAYAGLKANRPFVAGVGEKVVPMMASGGMGIVPAAMTFAGSEFLKPGTMGERGTRAAIEGGGSLIGGYIGNKVGNAIAPVADKAMTAAQREALKVAEKIGYKPRLSEITGSPYLARLEDFAARTPGGAGVMDDFARANQEAVNRHAATSIGEKADELTSDVFARASDRIGGVFNKMQSLPGKPIAIGQNVAAAADDVLRTQGKMIPSQRDAELVKLANQAKLLATNNGKIDGETYKLIRSGLSEQSFEANGTNKVLYGELLKALDDSAEKSLEDIGETALAKAFREARPQYGNLKTLEKGAVAKGGDVSPSAVASALRTRSPSAFREGRMEGNPLYDIGVLGERLRPLQAGSPTYERAVTGDLLATLAKAGPAYAAAKLTTGSIPRGYAGLLASNPNASRLLAQPIATLADPSSRALGGLLAQRFLLPGVPVMAE